MFYPLHVMSFEARRFRIYEVLIAAAAPALDASESLCCYGYKDIIH